MSLRRKLLLSQLANAYKWLPYSFEYLYHDLIPQKVNKNASLPSAYQEVEYIESSGTQYINTGVRATSTSGLEMLYSHLGLSSAGIIGTRSTACSFWILQQEVGNLLCFEATNQNRIISQVVGYNTGYHTFVANNNNFSIDGNLVSSYLNGADGSLNIYIFRSNDNGTAYTGDCKGKLKYCKLYDNGVLVRNFIPCYRKSDNVIGLYDSVNNQFYTNAGSGTFTKGNDVYRIVKDKTRLFKIEGNSEVVNQQNPNYDFSITDPSYFYVAEPTYLGYAVANNKLTLTLLNNVSSGVVIQLLNTKIVNTHKYLIKATLIGESGSNSQVLLGINSNNQLVNTISQGETKKVLGILTATADNTAIFVRLNGSYSSGQSFSIMDFEVIDLTQRYPFDTPTSLTDKRVQNIINRGSEDFNSGEIKNTSLGGFVSEGFNLFDKSANTTNALVDTLGTFTSNSNCKGKWLKCLPNTTYYLMKSKGERFNVGSNPTILNSGEKFATFNSNVNNNQITFTTGANDHWLFVWYMNINIDTTLTESEIVDTICINLSSSLNGTYKPHLNRLPMEYQEVEYIESTGTQYIDSGVLATDTTGLLINVAPLNNDEAVFIGTKINADVDSYYGLYIGINQSYKIFGNFNGNDDASARPTAQLNTKFLYKLNYKNDRKRYFNETELTSISTTLPSISYPIYIGCGNRVNNLWLGSSARFYSCQITDGTNIVRHFIPCFRKSDNEIGLFDLVNQVFYTNQGTGTFLKGANVNSVSDLSFAYQGSGVGTSHDSVEKTATEWVFTKANSTYTFSGSETWTETEQGRAYTTAIQSVATHTSSGTIKSNILCNAYNNVIPNDAVSGTTNDKVCTLNTSGAFVVVDRSIASGNFASAMTSKVVQYQLATPQVIRIPLKRLAVVDLGKDLNWVKNTTAVSGAVVYTSQTIANKVVSGSASLNAYCSQYQFVGIRDNLATNNQAIAIWNSSNAGNILVARDDSCSTEAEMKQKLQHQYFFYETEDEVADIDLTMGSEAGGTLNSYDFKWIKNQILTNGNFASVSGWSLNSNTSYSVSNNVATIVNTSGANNGVYQNFTAVAGHKYLCFGQLKLDESSSNQVSLLVYANGVYQSKYVKGTDWNNIGLIVEAGSSGGTFVKINLANWENKNVYAKEINLIDLTKAKLDDATSINDPRIQRIIKLGYIPTDINGTLTYEETEVLPNVDVKEKAK